MEVGRQFDVVGRYSYVSNAADDAARIGAYFIPRDLQHLGEDRFLSPRITQKLVDAFIEHRFLILGGRLDAQASYLLPHIAWALHDSLIQQKKVDHRMLFLECQPGIDLQYFDLPSELDKIGRPAIILIPSASRQHIGWRLPQIREAAIVGKHYVLCSSEIPLVSWKITGTDQLYWYDLSREVLFDPTHLTNVLVRSLMEHQEMLPAKLRHIVDPDQMLIAGLTIREVSRRLQTERAITVFLQLLCSVKMSVDDHELINLIDIAQENDDQAIKRWYYSGLSRREQLLALGVSFFDGLAEDQMFASLQELVIDIWRQKDAPLSIFDYVEIEKLRAFFLFTKTDATRSRIKSAIPNQRRILLELAWDSYRMHIRAAMPWLIQLVKNSLARDADTSDIYGPDQQRDELRRAISETLSDVGLISLDAVRDALLWLVADRRPPVQVVAARTMAHWYAVGKQREFFALIERWNEKRSTSFIMQVLKEQYPDKEVDVQECIDTAKLLAVSYAAKYDQPNQTSESICKIIKQLAQNPSERVLSRLENYTLPMLIPLHLSQLRDTLRDMLIHESLHQPMSDSLAGMYPKNYALVLQTLVIWLNECIRTPHRHSRELHENILAFIIRTLIDIWYIEDILHERARRILGRLHEIIHNERTSLVRATVIQAVLRQKNQDPLRFEQIESILHSVITDMPERERGPIVHLLTELYKQQRKVLTGGDSTFELDGVTYSTWIDLIRPSTVVESILFRWMTNEEHQSSQELALQASVQIARSFECDEEEFRQRQEYKRRRAEWKRREHRSRMAKIHIRARQVHDRSSPLQLLRSWLDSFMYWLATFQLQDYRVVVLSILPEADAQYQVNRREMQFLLHKWNRVIDFEDLPLFAKSLWEALKIVVNRKLIAIIIIAMLAVFILLAMYIAR